MRISIALFVNCIFFKLIRFITCLQLTDRAFATQIRHAGSIIRRCWLFLRQCYRKSSACMLNCLNNKDVFIMLCYVMLCRAKIFDEVMLIIKDLPIHYIVAEIWTSLTCLCPIYVQRHCIESGWLRWYYHWRL